MRPNAVGKLLSKDYMVTQRDCKNSPKPLNLRCLKLWSHYLKNLNLSNAPLERKMPYNLG